MKDRTALEDAVFLLRGPVFDGAFSILCKFTREEGNVLVNLPA